MILERKWVAPQIYQLWKIGGAESKSDIFDMAASSRGRFEAEVKIMV